MKKTFALGALLAAFLAPVPAVFSADNGQFGKVTRIDRSAFKSEAGKITFSEFTRGHKNPVYKPHDYGAPAGGVTVRFGGHFRGQRLSTAGQCPAGANRNGCISGTPKAPLQLKQKSPDTYIEDDSSNPTSPALSGTPRFNGAVSIWFNKDIAGVGLIGGFFDAQRSTAIQVYDRNGNLIGGVVNLDLGMEYLALVTEDGSNRIAGLQFSLVGAEPHGYAIDELSFALDTQVQRSSVPGLAAAIGEGAEVAPENAPEDVTPAPSPAAPESGSLSDLFGGDGSETDRAGGQGSLSDLFKSD